MINYLNSQLSILKLRASETETNDNSANESKTKDTTRDEDTSLNGG